MYVCSCTLCSLCRTREAIKPKESVYTIWRCCRKAPLRSLEYFNNPILLEIVYLQVIESSKEKKIEAKGKLRCMFVQGLQSNVSFWQRNKAVESRIENKAIISFVGFFCWLFLAVRPHNCNLRSIIMQVSHHQRCGGNLMMMEYFSTQERLWLATTEFEAR